MSRREGGHPVDPPSDMRAARKRAAILAAAAQVFFAQGYVGTSMDEIAAVAAVSKQTVYKHFGDKETLFHELVTTTVDDSPGSVAGAPVVGDDGAFDEGLRAFARHLLRGVMQPQVLQLRRLVIAEATRFPSLGRSFYDHSVAKTIGTLSAVLGRLAEERHLAVEDPRIAAEHFIWLVLSIPLNRAMLLGDDHGARAKDLDRYADAGVRAFLAAYAPAAQGRPSG